MQSSLSIPLEEIVMPSPSVSTSNSQFHPSFISTLDSASPINAHDDPNYYSRYPRTLLTTSNVEHFMTGSGASIYEAITPLLQSTNHELILVTCFWAQSDSLQTLNHILRHLSDKAVHRGTEKIRVRLCFSSLSIFQKLFHKQNVDGQVYQPNTWIKKLGLPDPRDLGGLDLKIKSVFLLPFSVMHPKFIIVDRQRVVLPSCNISWEEWFEGAIAMDGKVVEQFLKFYFTFWERRAEVPDVSWTADSDYRAQYDSASLKSIVALSSPNISTAFLPSPHRRNPRLRPLVSADRILAPPTPLNVFILTLFAKAERSIRIQTPNVTAPPVLSALLTALSRGVNVQILTSERLMILEQLVTAGTTTSRCIKKLIKRYKALVLRSYRRPMSDEEAAISLPKPGRLHIAYFESIGGPKKRGEERGEPQQSHLKMTIVDDEVLVLGSGNLDRASWFTSQELGVAFCDKDVVRQVGEAVDSAMRGRSKVIYDSESVH